LKIPPALSDYVLSLRCVLLKSLHSQTASRSKYSSLALPRFPRRREAIKTPLGLSYLKYVIQFKGPLDYARLDKYLADTNYLGVSRKAPHAKAAKLYVEFLCSPEGQKAVAGTGEFVLYPGIAPAVPGAAQVAQRSQFMDEPSAEKFKKLQTELRHMFFAGK
jgi:hypothetical protein